MSLIGWRRHIIAKLQAAVGRSLPRRIDLGARLGVIICLCTLATMIFAAAFFLREARMAADAKALALADDASSLLATRVEREVEQTFRAVTTTADSMAALWVHGIRDRRICDVLLRRMLDGNDDRFGAWTVWKPDAFDGRDKEFVGAPNSDGTGRYLTYWHQTEDATVLDAVTSHNDLSAPRFRTPLEHERPYLSSPRFIRLGPGPAVAVVSYSEPIVIESKLRGAIGLDAAMPPLQAAIRAIPLPEGGSITLVSGNGQVVATTNPRLVGGSLTVPRLAGGARATNRMEIGNSRGAILRIWRPVSFSDVETPWYLLTEIEVRAFAADGAHGRIAAIAVAVGMFLAMLAVILAAMRRIVTKPLARIERYIRTLRDQTAPQDWPDTRRDDEIGSIGRTLVAFKVSEQEVARLKEAEAERLSHYASRRRDEQDLLADHLARSVQTMAGIVDATSRKIMHRAEAVAAAAVVSVQKTKVIAEASDTAATNVSGVDEATGALQVSTGRIGAEMSHAKRIAELARREAEASTGVTVELSSRAARIGEIVGMIASIAQSTNMLALNATIEAARAGEAGRGFAVVAQEVKALAKQTTDATVEIEAQITSMQQTAEDAAQTLVSIGGIVGEIAGISASIAESVSAQGEMTDQIGRSVGAAVAASRRVGEVIGDVDDAASQTGTAASEMVAESTRLADESRRLNDEVLDFIAKIRVA